MKQKDRRLCKDVAVKRGAVCNTDHHLVVVRVKMWRDRRGCGVLGARGARIRRYDVGKLLRKAGKCVTSTKRRCWS